MNLTAIVLLAPLQALTPDPQPFWSYSVMGTGIGASDFVVAEVQGQPELFCGGGTSGFGQNDLWYALRRDAGGAWQQVHVSSLYVSGIRRLGLGHFAPGAPATLAILRGDGRVDLHDCASKEFVGGFQTAAAAPTSMDVADFDGDGRDEILVLDAAAVRVYEANGALIATGNAGGEDLVFAQMDADPQGEIAVTSGVVLDGLTMAPQWTWGTGFGRELAAEDLDGDGKAELVAMEDWNFVWAYNVDQQLPWWSLPRFDNDAMRLVDVEDDGAWELLVGDGQWGDVVCYDAATAAFKWSVNNPEHGVTDVTMFDADGDGDKEVVWGAGHTSSGADFLYVADWQSGALQWRSEHLDGPFVGPLVGDVDGDGRPELVSASYEAESGYDSGRILVFDAQTLALEGMSAPVVGNRSWTGLNALRLHDADGDGRQEIAIGADNLYDGAIEIYDFANGAFTLNWTNAGQEPDGAPFASLALADVDQDGDVEIVGGGSRAHTGAQGVFVYVYDYSTGVEEWHSIQMGAYWDAIGAVEVADADGDGAPEILGMVEGGDLYVYEGATKALEAIVFGDFTSLTVHESGGTAFLLLGDALGRVHAYAWNGAAYAPVVVRTFAAARVDGIAPGPQGTVFLGAGGRLIVAEVASGAALWTSDDFGAPFGAQLARPPSGVLPFFSAGRFSIVGFRR